MRVRPRVVIPGQQLIAQAKLAPLSDPTLAALAKRGALARTVLYLVVFDRAAVPRYRTALAEHFGPHAVRVLHAGESDDSGREIADRLLRQPGPGLAGAPLALAHKLDLFARAARAERRALRRARDRPHLRELQAYTSGPRRSSFSVSATRCWASPIISRHGGRVQALRPELRFDRNLRRRIQDQKGNDGLAEKAIERTTRVQAISKTELDKLDFDTVVARYLLGVRERNVRVVYLRPFLHEQNGMSLEKTNVEMVRAIATGSSRAVSSSAARRRFPNFPINPS
jgi:hypothetical protein